MTAVAADVALRQLTSTVGLSQLLGDDHLAEFRQWQRENRDARAPDAVTWLVDQGWITRWQGQQLLAGNHSFFLRHYKLVNRLGGGGMGTVFQAIDDRDGRLVAVKVLRKSAMQRPNTLERFRREIAALGKLRHPNIVAAYEAGQLNGYHYLVMEYIEGRDIGYWIAKLKKFPIEMACEIARQAALGLDHAHRLGFIHRDIKPSNLIAVRKADGLDVRILDFGLARNFDGATEEARVTKAGQIVGTVDYLAPEQAQGSNDVDGRADVYSLGVTLFEMIAGQVPFTGESMMARLVARVMHPAPLLSEFRPEAPPSLVEALDRALAMRQADRFATAGDFAEALANVEVQTKKSSALAATVEMSAPSVEGVAETMPRTPETAAPIYDEFQKALSDKAQSTGDSQTFTLPSWMKRRRAWIVAAAVVLFVLFASLLSRGSKTGRIEQPGEAAASTSPMEQLSREAAALADRPDPTRVQRLWKEIWALTDAKHDEQIRQGAFVLAASAPHPLDATFAAGEVQRTVYKPGFFESLGAGKRIRKLAFSPDGRTAASLSEHRVILHDLIANAIEELAGEELGSPTCLAFSPGGDSLVVGTQEGAVHRFEMNSRTLVQTMSGEGSTIAVGFLRDGLGVVSTHASKKTILRRFSPSGVTEKSFIGPHAATTMTFVPNKEAILLGSPDGRTTALDLASGSAETNWPFKSTIAAAEYSPDGKHVMVLGWEGACWRIDGPTYTQVWELPVSTSSKWAAAWSSSWDERLLTLTSNGLLQLRSWKAGEVEWERDALGGSRQAAALAVSPEGRFAAVQSKDGGIELIKLPAIKM